MKLIIFNGSSCSGKSTIIKNIMKQKDHFYHLSYDLLRWSFSNYRSETHYEDVRKVVLAVAEAVFKMKYDVVSEILYAEQRQKLIDLAVKHSYEILEINLEADFEVLAERFDERVAKALATPVAERRISNLSKERFKELFDIFHREKNSSAVTFRTDRQSIEEISENIMKLL
ncbi:MAG: AAA family ATPase [Patescibacteria group bacterium]